MAGLLNKMDSYTTQVWILYYMKTFNIQDM